MIIAPVCIYHVKYSCIICIRLPTTWPIPPPAGIAYFSFPRAAAPYSSQTPTNFTTCSFSPCYALPFPYPHLNCLCPQVHLSHCSAVHWNLSHSHRTGEDTPSSTASPCVHRVLTSGPRLFLNLPWKTTIYNFERTGLEEDWHCSLGWPECHALETFGNWSFPHGTWCCDP